MEESETTTQLETQPLPLESPSHNHFCCSISNCKSNTLLYFLAVFLILVILSGVAYLYRTQNQPTTPVPVATKTTLMPTTNPTATWKTYNNNVYKYSFKYPPNFTLSLAMDYNPPELGVSIVNPEKTIIIGFTEPTGSLSGNSSVNELSKVSGLIFNVLEKSYSPSEAYYNNVYKKYVFRIYPISSELVIGISGEYITDNDLNVINQILSTFRYLDQLTSTPAIQKTICKSCPQLIPPHPDWCKNGTVLPPVDIINENENCYCSSPPKCERSGVNDSTQSLCESSADGRWLSEFNECEGISSKQCTDVGGIFDHCASACRHNPNYPNVNCIEVCVPVCVIR